MLNEPIEIPVLSAEDINKAAVIANRIEPTERVLAQRDEILRAAPELASLGPEVGGAFSSGLSMGWILGWLAGQQQAQAQERV